MVYNAQFGCHAMCLSKQCSAALHHFLCLTRYLKPDVEVRKIDSTTVTCTQNRLRLRIFYSYVSNLTMLPHPLILSMVFDPTLLTAGG